MKDNNARTKRYDMSIHALIYLFALVKDFQNEKYIDVKEMKKTFNHIFGNQYTVFLLKAAIKELNDKLYNTYMLDDDTYDSNLHVPIQDIFDSNNHYRYEIKLHMWIVNYLLSKDRADAFYAIYTLDNC